MSTYSINKETLDSLSAKWPEWSRHLKSEVFVQPWWLKTWYQSFGWDKKLRILSVEQGGDIIGVAPLMQEDGGARFIGNKDVCDYQDFAVAPGREQVFFAELIRYLQDKGAERLELGPVRPDSTVMTSLAAVLRSQGRQPECKQEDVSLEADLPSSWDAYLESLTGKQRHELRRKLRKLEASGAVNYRLLSGDDAIGSAFDTFLTLFRESRSDKATFLTPEMEMFFRALAKASAQAGVLRIGVLELDGLTVASVMCFDYNNELYLYNSGFDVKYASLSVGLISKALSIRKSIEDDKKRFNFLKGDEEYKYHLGGKEVPISSCLIDLK